MRVLICLVRWVVGSILHGGPIELFLVPATAPRLVYVFSCLWDDACTIQDNFILIRLHRVQYGENINKPDSQSVFCSG